MTDDVTALVERIRPHKLTGDDAGIYMKARLAREVADALERLLARVAELEELMMQELSDIGQEIERDTRPAAQKGGAAPRDVQITIHTKAVPLTADDFKFR